MSFLRRGTNKGSLNPLAGQQPAPGTPVVDDVDEFWDAQGFVDVVKRGAAIALALTVTLGAFPADDEWPTPGAAPTIVEESEAFTPVTVRSLYASQPFQADDDILVTGLGGDDAWQAPDPVRSRVQSLTWTDGDDLPTRIDEDYWWQAPSVARSLSLGGPWVVEDELPRVTVFDDDPWSSTKIQPPAQVALWTGEDELPGFVAPAFVEDDPWTPGVVQPASAKSLQLWTNEDELPRGTVFDEDSGWSSFRIQPPIQSAISSLADEFPATTATIVEEDGWQPPLLLVSAAKSQVWTADDELPRRTTFEEDSLQPFTILPRLVLVLTPQVQEDELPRRTVFDDDPWSASKIQPPARVVLWTGEDELPSGSVPLDASEFFVVWAADRWFLVDAEGRWMTVAPNHEAMLVDPVGRWFIVPAPDRTGEV